MTIACGLYRLSKGGEFHTLFGRLKRFKYFKMGISEFENFRAVVHSQSKEEYKYIRRQKICKITVYSQLLCVCRLGTYFGYTYTHTHIYIYIYIVTHHQVEHVAASQTYKVVFRL